MNRKWWKFLFLLPISVCTLYAGGYAAQFIKNYQEWTSAGNFAGNGTYPQAASLHPLVCFHTALTDFPYNLYGIFLCLVLFGLLTFLLMRMGYDRNGEISDHDRNLNYSTKGTYGTSGFMTPDEMMKVLELTGDVKKNKGTILGKLNGKAVCLPYQTRMNKNIAVYGASGSMKSRAFARNMIFQCVARGQEGNNASGESLIITDPKSELYESMSAYLENEGYVVKAFNLVNPENSDSWNCLGEINGQETMAQVFADVIIQNTGSGKGDHFWDNAEMNLLKALVLYVDQGFPPEARNIGQVYKLLTMSSEKELNSLFDLLPVSHPAKVPYCIYKQASDTVRSGVIIGLGARLQVFQNKLIRQITSYDEIDLTLPGKQKCAYFCITSDQDSTFDFLSSLFMTFIFIKLVRYADKYRAVIPISEMMINLIQDETHDYGDFSLRQNKVLNNMLGSEIDFVIKGLDTKSRSIVASRKDAMLKKRQIFYFDQDSSGQNKIHEDRIVQARVIAVAEKVVRAEIFGVETSILARDLSFDWLGDARERFQVGEHILVRILAIQGDSPETLSIHADVKSVEGNTSKENLKNCRVQGKYAGTVEDIHKGTVFVRLELGVNAIAHSCYDSRTVGKKDKVSFVVTHIDEERNVAVGIITRIIKQNI